MNQAFARIYVYTSTARLPLHNARYCPRSWLTSSNHAVVVLQTVPGCTTDFSRATLVRTTKSHVRELPRAKGGQVCTASWIPNAPETWNASNLGAKDRLRRTGGGQERQGPFLFRTSSRSGTSSWQIDCLMTSVGAPIVKACVKRTERRRGIRARVDVDEPASSALPHTTPTTASLAHPFHHDRRRQTVHDRQGKLRHEGELSRSFEYVSPG